MYLFSDFNYEASKEFVDFYVLGTFLLNEKCTPELYHGVTPIHEINGLPALVILLNLSYVFQTQKVFVIIIYILIIRYPHVTNLKI